MGARRLTADKGRASGEDGAGSWRGHEDLPLAFDGLETAILDGCAVEGEWPAQIAGGVYAGVDFAIANPIVARALTIDVATESGCVGRYERVIGRLAGFIQIKAPRDRRLPGSTDEALVAGLVGLVGDHIRIGRLDRLAELRPELVLMVLLPYLGFVEAQRWANQTAQSRPSRP
ncbi:MAG: hypothetical protein WA862_11660 [Solirubrobacterales bacterium]